MEIYMEIYIDIYSQAPGSWGCLEQETWGMGQCLLFSGNIWMFCNCFWHTSLMLAEPPQQLEMHAKNKGSTARKALRLTLAAELAGCLQLSPQIGTAAIWDPNFQIVEPRPYSTDQGSFYLFWHLHNLPFSAYLPVNSSEHGISLTENSVVYNMRLWFQPQLSALKSIRPT